MEHEPDETTVTIRMCAVGAATYRDWEASKVERGKLNAVANLVSRVYRAMEAERERDEADK